MIITMYERTFPVLGAPVSLSLIPFSSFQRHTYTLGEDVYESQRREFQITVPDNATIDTYRNMLSWVGSDKRRMKSTATEVFTMAEQGILGFGTV